MPIPRYTTTIDAAKTVGQIQALLAKAGAREIMVSYDGGIPVAVAFMVPGPGEPLGFRLPANVAGVLAAMKKDRRVSGSQCTTEQAARVTWRILLNWIEAQLAIIEAGQAQLAEVFFPYHMENGHTAYERFVETKLLPMAGRDNGRLRE